MSDSSETLEVKSKLEIRRVTSGIFVCKLTVAAMHGLHSVYCDGGGVSLVYQ